MTDSDRENFLHKALLYAAGSCARSEQCEADIRLKLLRKGLSEGEAQQIIEYLKEHNYLNETRYAQAYARSKSRLSGWGPWKIKNALALKGISHEVILEAVQQIDSEVFARNALEAAQRKSKKLNLDNAADRARIYRLLSSRGFDSDIINRTLAALHAPADD